MKELKWALMSTARINRSLILPFRMSKRNSILAVASRNIEKAQSFAKEWSIPRAYGSYDSLLADPEIDVVYIPLPNTMHAEWAIKALEAGKHVLCEKPLAMNVQEVDQMTEASQKAGKILMEAFMFRFHKRTLQVKSMIDDGAIGDVHHVNGAFSITLNRPGNFRWDSKFGGGCLWDVGCYPLNFTRYLLGTEPIKIHGSQIQSPSGIDESFAAQMIFPNDIIAQFDASYRSQFRMHMEIIGKKGSIYLPMAFKPDRRSYIILTQGNDVQHIAVDGNLIYLDEIEHMADRILSDVPAIVSLEDSRANTECITALYRSAINR